MTAPTVGLRTLASSENWPELARLTLLKKVAGVDFRHGSPDVDGESESSGPLDDAGGPSDDEPGMIEVQQ